MFFWIASSVWSLVSAAITAPSEKPPVPLEKWFCYEWHVTPTSASVFVDGKELTDAKATGWTIANATSLQIGYERFQPGMGTGGELWLDDIAINTAQIGCQ